MRRWEWLAEQVSKKGWTRGVEVGVKEGRTIGHLLHTCPELHMIGVDLWGLPDGIENPEDYTGWDFPALKRQAESRVRPYGDRAELWHMSSREAAEKARGMDFDFVFIDANHGYEGVLEDIRLWMPFIKPGGYLVGHDIDWDGVHKAVSHEFSVNYRTAPDNIWFVDLP